MGGEFDRETSIKRNCRNSSLGIEKFPPPLSSLKKNRVLSELIIMDLPIMEKTHENKFLN